MDTYSGGADSTALRLLIKKAAVSGWEGASLDIKTAFLNATLDDDQEDYIAVKPPSIFVSQGFMSADDVYIAQRAVYGLRRSPRLWGKTRDRELHAMRLEVDGEIYVLEPLLSEPHVWKVVAEEADLDEDPTKIQGLIMTYVDDILMAAAMKILKALIHGIQSLWKSTDPEFVGEKSIRFLGMDISKHVTDSGVVWKVTQDGYIRDLLQKEVGLRRRRLPITRDQSLEIEEEKEPAGAVREAQRQVAVGELLWTVTRTRPDLMYAVSKMGSAVLRNPEGEGLCFSSDGISNPFLEVFTDASYGEHAHGCVIVFLFGSPMLWKSGKQGTASMSTAEAELQEMVEGMVAGESTFAIAKEPFEDMAPILWTDSQSAQAIMTGEGGALDTYA